MTPSRSKHSRVSTKLYYNRKVSARTRARIRVHRHDGCLYEAVIYFIIGRRGPYNPRLGNEAIHGRLPFLCFSLAFRGNARKKFDRTAQPELYR